MNKIRTNVYIDYGLKKDVDESGLNLSHFLEECLLESKYSVEGHKQKIIEYESKLEYHKKMLILAEKIREKTETINDGMEIKQLKLMNDILERQGYNEDKRLPNIYRFINWYKEKHGITLTKNQVENKKDFKNGKVL